MGQTQNKYHITDDGKIFSVMEDGSVSEIGNVSSLNQTKNIDEPKQPKSRKWKWIAGISWVVLIIATITFLVQHEDASNYITYLNNQNSELEQNLTQTQSDLNSKIAEIDSINQQIYRERQNHIPITITGVQFSNENYYSQLIDNYGSTLYSSRVCFLKPKFSFTGKKSGTFTLTEKLIRPDGTVLHGDSSPDNATQSFRLNTSSGRSGQYELAGWGWKEAGNYEAGRWTFQICYDDAVVYSTTFDIH